MINAFPLSIENWSNARDTPSTRWRIKSPVMLGKRRKAPWSQICARTRRSSG